MGTMAISSFNRVGEHRRDGDSLSEFVVFSVEFTKKVADAQSMKTNSKRDTVGSSHIQELGLGGRGWTERSEGSPGVSGYRPPTPATLNLRFDKPLAQWYSI